jgi:hypothetical protein
MDTSQKIAIGLVAVALFVGSMPAHAADLSVGYKAYQSGDYATALRIFRQFAGQGDTTAQFNLGLMYGNGRGVPQDYKEAMRWYRKAADQGVANAQYNVGVMYEKGRGVPQDYGEAVKWYRKAADQGDADAQFNLGIMYRKGQGVTQNYVQAHMWFNFAAARGDKNARESRDRLAEQMTPEQIAEAQRLAREWKPKGK